MTICPVSDLLDRIDEAWPVSKWLQYNVVVAVSGGADSVALLKALCLIRERALSDFAEEDRRSGSLIAAHFNHRIRGRESDLDEEFVSQLAADIGVRYCSDRANAGTSSESRLRDERYEFLERIARKTNSRYVVTAHHLDDQVETVLFRLFRGTGINGLGGIPKLRVVDESLTIVRPMLELGRERIRHALQAWDQPFRIDATNEQSAYTRNFIRNDLLPLVRTRFPAPVVSISRLSKQAREQQMFLESQVEPLLKHVVFERHKIEVDCRKLRSNSIVVLRQLVARLFQVKQWSNGGIGFESIEIVANLIESEEDRARFQLPGMINCQKSGGNLTLSTKQ